MGDGLVGPETFVTEHKSQFGWQMWMVLQGVAVSPAKDRGERTQRPNKCISGRRIALCTSPIGPITLKPIMAHSDTEKAGWLEVT